MPGIVIFLLIRVKMLLYFLYGTYRNGNSYKFTPFLRIYAFGNVCWFYKYLLVSWVSEIINL